MHAGQGTHVAAAGPLGGKGCARIILPSTSRHGGAPAGLRSSAFASRPRPPPLDRHTALLDETSPKDPHCNVAAQRGCRPG